MNTRLEIPLIVLEKIVSLQEYEIKSVSPETMEFSGTATHVQSHKDSDPLI